MPVDDELRDARRGGDVLHRGRRVAGPGEGAGGAGKDRRLTGGAGQGTGRSGIDDGGIGACHMYTHEYTLGRVPVNATSADGGRHMNLQLEWAEDDLLATDEISEP